MSGWSKFATWGPSLSLLGWLLCCVPGPAPAAAERFESVGELIRNSLRDSGAPSVSVAVAQGDQIIWEQGFGWANRERRVVATAHTAYPVASVTKPLTATALMTLVQAGKVDLDRPANDYLGPAKLRAHVGDVNQATVRRLANHSAGLPLHYRAFRIDGSVRQPSLQEALLRYGALVSAPGEETSYSNLGFGAIGEIIERTSGEHYADYMRREVFLPLGMTRTSVGIGPGLEDFVATRYGENGLPVAPYETDTPAAAAVFASAHDLARFGLFHLKTHRSDQKQILSDSSLEEMHRRTSLTDDGGGYGVGFGRREVGGHSVLLHSGGQEGVSSLLVLLPEQRIAVVVLCNSRSKLPWQVVDAVLGKLVPRWPGLPQPQWVPPPAFSTPSELLGTWQGTLRAYDRTFPVELNFLADGLVRARFDQQMPTLIDRAKFDAGVFSGDLISRIGTEDTEGYDYKVSLALRLREGVLGGAALASNDLVLASWLELRRK
ncbi:serine hydrolase domain-containing protein [Steroidobacter sp.]|uniref:serine hydrolase domain-containing protein n=1 Tax=Steroidobacter sp. TaxID=1978227 RepID=UPI001A59879D|nr:serine hydrolase domain-containing protein [Steroidobacter sp.]MBL8271993.1 beta-lactamase family protein [Steroidobacter sp.]